MGDDCEHGVCEENVCQAPTCEDGVHNGDESDVDCGKVCPEKCEPRKGCAEDADCDSGVCAEAAETCVAPTCVDALLNGTETDLDCGGPSCLPCADGDKCVVSGDCVSGLCDAEVCIRKPIGQACAANEQCLSGFCADNVCCENACSGTCKTCNLGATPGVCSNIPTNTDPANECSGADVCNGAGACVKVNGASCGGAGECVSGFCTDGVCCESTCSGTCQACAAVKTGSVNGTCGPIMANTDPDSECALAECDGTGACEVALGVACTQDSQCVSGECVDGVCCGMACDGGCQACNTAGSVGTCINHAADTDPENACTAECNGAGLCEVADGNGCYGDTDCESGFCNSTTMLCATPTCMDTFTNGDETDVDCGGSCAATCDTGEGCISPLDCTSQVCTGNTCQAPTCFDGVRNGDETGIDCGNATCGSCFLILAAGSIANNVDLRLGTFDVSAGSPAWTIDATPVDNGFATLPGAAMMKDGKGLVVYRDSDAAGEFRFSFWNGSSWSAVADVDNDTGNAFAISGSPTVVANPGANQFVAAYRFGNVLQSRTFNAVNGTWSNGLNIGTLANTNAFIQPDITFRAGNPYAVFIDNSTPALFFSENTGSWSAKTSLDNTAVLGAAPPEAVTMSTGAVLTVFFKNTPVTNALHSKLSTVAGGWGAGAVTAQVGGSTAVRPALVALPNNKAALAWRDGPSNNAFLSIYNGATNTWSATAVNVSGAAIDGAPSVARGMGGMVAEVLYTLNASPKNLTHARFDGTDSTKITIMSVTNRENVAIAAPPVP